MKTSAFLAMALAFSPLVALKPPETFPNPLIEQRADPQVFRDTDGTYYFMGTVPEYDRLELRKSATVAGLATATPKVIWRKHDTGPMGAHIWAPEIHRIDGKWYVYFAAGDAKKIWNIRMYVLENSAPDPLQGEWVEKGHMKMNWESFTLDGTTFVNRGTRYFVWAQNDPKTKGNSSIYIAEMENPWTLRGKQVLLTKPELPWEQHRNLAVNEGPAILQKNGRIFLTYSASATDDTYCLGLLTASDTSNLLDPKSWAKSPAPVFKSNEKNAQWGPGHNAFTTSEDGKTDLLVYHARSYKDIKGDPLHDPNRHTRVQPIAWAPDGTPLFGEPGAPAGNP